MFGHETEATVTTVTTTTATTNDVLPARRYPCTSPRTPSPTLPPFSLLTAQPSRPQARQFWALYASNRKQTGLQIAPVVR